MNVLVKGMKKPKDCWECFDTWGKCMCIDFHVSGVHTELCPLVEVSTPHGRLVDIDEVYKALTEYYHHTTDVQHMALQEALAKVPTIVEAEKGK